MKKRFIAAALGMILTICIIALPIGGASADNTNTNTENTNLTNEDIFKIYQNMAFMPILNLQSTVFGSANDTNQLNTFTNIKLYLQIQPSMNGYIYGENYLIEINQYTTSGGTATNIYSTGYYISKPTTTEIIELNTSNFTMTSGSIASDSQTRNLFIQFNNTDNFQNYVSTSGINGSATYKMQIKYESKIFNNTMNSSGTATLSNESETIFSIGTYISNTMNASYSTIFFNECGFIGKTNTVNNNVLYRTLSINSSGTYTYDDYINYGNYKYNAGKTEGYNTGYSEGYNKGSADQQNLFGYIAAIGEAPANMIQEMFNFEIMGVNVSTVIFALLTTALVVILLKKFT